MALRWLADELKAEPSLNALGGVAATKVAAEANAAVAMNTRL